MTRAVFVYPDNSAVVDDADYERVSQYRWHTGTNLAGTLYAYRTGRKDDGPLAGKQIPMHREILAPPAGMDVDHIDRDGLNNQRGNLRAATRTQNNGNSRPKRPGRPYKGITQDKKHGGWKAQITKGKGRNIYLGYFNDPADAARAYDRAAREYFGEYARLNFPEPA